MTKQQWTRVAARMAEARDAMIAMNAGEAGRIFNCLEHFAKACADIMEFPADGDEQP